MKKQSIFRENRSVRLRFICSSTTIGSRGLAKRREKTRPKRRDKGLYVLELGCPWHETEKRGHKWNQGGPGIQMPKGWHMKMEGISLKNRNITVMSRNCDKGDGSSTGQQPTAEDGGPDRS